MAIGEMRLILANLALCSFVAFCAPRPRAPSTLSEVDKVYALKYGESVYPARLVNTTEKDTYVRFNWLAYLVVASNGSKTLIDTGFSNSALRRRFALKNFRAVEHILGDLHISRDEISRVILTHSHFDHALDIDRYEKAQVILHQAEFEAPQDEAVKRKLDRLLASGRLLLIQGDLPLGDLQIIPTRGHTPGSLIVTAKYGGKDIVFTGDECYNAAACRAGIALPSPSAYSTKANRAFIANISPRTRLLAGHETDLRGGSWLTDYVFFFAR